MNHTYNRVFLLCMALTLLASAMVAAEASGAEVVEPREVDLDRLNEGRYVFTYQEHYYDGVGESVLTIKRTPDGYLAVWDGIYDSTEVYTDNKFNTLRILFTDEDTSLTVERQGQRLRVSGVDEGESIDKSLTLDSENWYQLLPFSLIPFTTSDQQKVKFALFDPFNLKVRNMQIQKNKQDTITVLGENYDTLKLSMRMSGFFTAFWKSEMWHLRQSGIQAKYEGLNVVPKFYKSKIYLKSIEFFPN